MQQTPHEFPTARPRRARPKGVSNVDRPRCEWCIASRQRCDSTQPVCGKCRKVPSRCKWPSGNPSRSGLFEENTRNHGDGTTDEEPQSNVTAGEMSGLADPQFQEWFDPEGQVLHQGEAAADGGPHLQDSELPVGNQAPDDSSTTGSR